MANTKNETGKPGADKQNDAGTAGKVSAGTSVGNIGEAPMPAFEAAAPYVVGSHFKDHHVRPCLDARPLHFEVGPSVIGEGNVPLRECYQLLREQAPHPDRLVMKIELIPPPDLDPVVAFERSLAFVRTLERQP